MLLVDTFLFFIKYKETVKLTAEKDFHLCLPSLPGFVEWRISENLTFSLTFDC